MKRTKVNRPIRISIEGNIATGKSTFIKILESAGDDWEITPEPVANWTKIDKNDGTNASGGNLLKLFYEDPKRWAYTFQSYALLSRMRLVRRPCLTHITGRFAERSIHSDRYIFARNCFETGLMTETEWAIYQDWSSYLLDSLGELQLDGFIYLRCDPDICASRMSKRGRPEEKAVTVEYLKQLHEKHENWLHKKDFHCESIMEDIPVLEIDCNKEFESDESRWAPMLDEVRSFVDKIRSKQSRENRTDSGIDSNSPIYTSTESDDDLSR